MRRDEGKVRPALAVSVAVLASLVVVVSVLAVTLTPTATALAGSTFQGGDGNQDDALGLTDWENLAAPGLVAINDPNALDSTYATGSNESNPLAWDEVGDPDGVAPAKANVFNVWASVDHVAGHNFLYLAFNREESGGNVFLAFELNQDTRQWTNASGDQISCRTTGDIIVSYEIQNDDNIDLIIQRWVSVTVVSAAEAAGGLTNGEGCAKTGTLVNFEPPLADVQAAINVGVAVENFLPGGPEPTIGEELFGEAALDLTDIFSGMSLSPCYSFGQISAHTRSSESDTASLWDLVEPAPFQVGNCTAAGVKYEDLNANGNQDAGEPGLGGFRIWADYDNDGVLDANEPFGDTDAGGAYLIENIVPPPPDETFSLREQLTSGGGTGGWLCSEPTTTIANGTFACAYVDINASVSPVVTGMDFGNYKNATVIVEKQTQPNGTPGSFAFTSTIPGKANFNLTDGQANSTVVTPGVYTATESVPAGWSLTDITCSGDTIAPNSSDAGNTATFNAQSGETITCAFTNSQDAHVTIVKDAIPNDAQDFGFAGSFGAFSLDDDADGTLDNNTTFTVSAASFGQRTVTESAVAGWTLTDITCSEGTDQDATATLQVDAGDDITCLFTNKKDAHVTIVKDAIPNDAQDFGFAGSFGAFSLDDDADGTLDDETMFTVAAGDTFGQKTVTESAVAGWTLTGLECSEGNENVGTRAATLQVDPGDDITCTFVNTKGASLTIVKVTDPASDPQDFDFDLTGPGVPADLDLDTDADDATLPSQQTFSLSAAQLGAYTVLESGVVGWSLTNLVCTGAGADSSTNLGSRVATLDIDAGETVVCIFTSTKAVPTAAPTAPSQGVGAGTGGQTPTTPPTATERPVSGGSSSLTLVLWALLAIAGLSMVATRARPPRGTRRS